MHTLTSSGRPELRSPERNNYFYGKHLTEASFTGETRYMNSMRALINRRVLGYGVVCGLNVLPGPGDNQIIVAPGVALDGWGRETIVPTQTAPIVIPTDLMSRAVAKCRDEDEDEYYLHVVLCHHECLSDPEPTFAGDCNVAEPCAPGTIREEYRIEFREGRAPDISTECRIPDLVSNGRIDYEVLAHWVSRHCSDLPKDPCICLATIEIEEHEGRYHCKREEINIDCRPIVYTNRLLFDILLCLGAAESPSSGEAD